MFAKQRLACLFTHSYESLHGNTVVSISWITEVRVDEDMGEENQSFISHESTYIVLPEMISCDSTDTIFQGELQDPEAQREDLKTRRQG